MMGCNGIISCKTPICPHVRHVWLGWNVCGWNGGMLLQLRWQDVVAAQMTGDVCFPNGMISHCSTATEWPAATRHWRHTYLLTGYMCDSNRMISAATTEWSQLQQQNDLSCNNTSKIGWIHQGWHPMRATALQQRRNKSATSLQQVCNKSATSLYHSSVSLHIFLTHSREAMTPSRKSFTWRIHETYSCECIQIPFSYICSMRIRVRTFMRPIQVSVYIFYFHICILWT